MICVNYQIYKPNRDNLEWLIGINCYAEGDILSVSSHDIVLDWFPNNSRSKYYP